MSSRTKKKKNKKRGKDFVHPEMLIDRSYSKEELYNEIAMRQNAPLDMQQRVIASQVETEMRKHDAILHQRNYKTVEFPKRKNRITNYIQKLAMMSLDFVGRDHKGDLVLVDGNPQFLMKGYLDKSEQDFIAKNKWTSFLFKVAGAKIRDLSEDEKRQVTDKIVESTKSKFGLK